jgi:hypothetical protein
MNAVSLQLTAVPSAAVELMKEDPREDGNFNRTIEAPAQAR